MLASPQVLTQRLPPDLTRAFDNGLIRFLVGYERSAAIRPGAVNASHLHAAKSAARDVALVIDITQLPRAPALLRQLVPGLNLGAIRHSNRHNYSRETTFISERWFNRDNALDLQLYQWLLESRGPVLGTRPGSRA